MPGFVPNVQSYLSQQTIYPVNSKWNYSWCSSDHFPQIKNKRFPSADTVGLNSASGVLIFGPEVFGLNDRLKQ